MDLLEPLRFGRAGIQSHDEDEESQSSSNLSCPSGYGGNGKGMFICGWYGIMLGSGIMGEYIGLIQPEPQGGHGAGRYCGSGAIGMGGSIGYGFACV